MTLRLRVSVLVVALALAGCAAVSKVSTGETVVKGRLAVDVTVP